VKGADGSAPRRPNRRREQTDLYATVLEVIKRYHGEARVTRVSYGAGMPVDRLKSLLERLANLGLVAARDVDGRPAYTVTPRGQEFLTTYWKMRGYTELFRSAEGAAQAPDPRGPGFA
jgi:predicted transcriptional regulator